MKRTAANHDHCPLCRGCEERGVGELYVAGDQACTQGDAYTLLRIAQHLVEHVGEPLHCELLPLVSQCGDYAQATRAWNELKQKLEPVPA